MKQKKAQGFTIVELMITLIVAAVLVGWAVPSMRNFILGARLTAQTNTLVAALQYARSEAIKRATMVTVGPQGASSTATAWGTNGWQVFIDADGDGILDAGEVVLRTEAAAPSNSDYATVTTTTAPLTYRANGSASTAMTATLCSSSYKSTKNARQVAITAVGTIQTTETTCP